MRLSPPAAPAQSAHPAARNQNPQRPPQPPYLRLRFLHRPSFVFDVVIAGGGPAGLSAALLLGRCRRGRGAALRGGGCGRRVLLCDGGQPRNRRSRALHGYLSRDGIAPLELLRIGREELREYNVESREISVDDVTRSGDHFDVRLEGGEHVPALTVLLATGVADQPPD